MLECIRFVEMLYIHYQYQNQFRIQRFSACDLWNWNEFQLFHVVLCTKPWAFFLQRAKLLLQRSLVRFIVTVGLRFYAFSLHTETWNWFQVQQMKILFLRIRIPKHCLRGILKSRRIWSIFTNLDHWCILGQKWTLQILGSKGQSSGLMWNKLFSKLEDRHTEPGLNWSLINTLAATIQPSPAYSDWLSCRKIHKPPPAERPVSHWHSTKF